MALDSMVSCFKQKSGLVRQKDVPAACLFRLSMQINIIVACRGSKTCASLMRVTTAGMRPSRRPNECTLKALRLCLWFSHSETLMKGLLHWKLNECNLPCALCLHGGFIS